MSSGKVFNSFELFSSSFVLTPLLCKTCFVAPFSDGLALRGMNDYGDNALSVRSSSFAWKPWVALGIHGEINSRKRAYEQL
jgi:hypothetical protein